MLFTILTCSVTLRKLIILVNRAILVNLSRPSKSNILVSEVDVNNFAK